MKWILAVLLICVGCASQGQINWRRQSIAPPADSLGNPTDAYILGVSNNVIWRMFPVSLLATNVTAGLQFPYTAITNAPWLTITNPFAVGEFSLRATSSATNYMRLTENGGSAWVISSQEGAGLASLDIDGTVSASAFTGDGSGLLNVTADNALHVIPFASYTNRTVDMTAQTNVWDDIVFPLTTLNPPGLESPATLISTNGPSGDQMALYTEANNVLFVVAQLPHTWVPESKIYPHIHTTPASINSVTSVWRVAYAVSDIGSALPTDTVVTQQVITPAGQWVHRLNDVPTNGISMTGKVGPSTIISIKYTLLSTSEPLRIKSYDVHYRYGGTPVIFNP